MWELGKVLRSDRERLKVGSDPIVYFGIFAEVRRG